MLTKALDALPDALTLENWDSERVSSDCFVIRRRVGVCLVLALGARDGCASRGRGRGMFVMLLILWSVRPWFRDRTPVPRARHSTPLAARRLANSPNPGSGCPDQ